MISDLKPYPETKDSSVKWLGEVPAHWQVLQAKRCYEIQLGKMLQRLPRDSQDEQVRYLKARNVQWFELDTSDVDTMYASADERGRYGVGSGDLLVCEGGEGGRCALATVTEEIEPCIIQNALHRVRPRASSGDMSGLNDYLQYVLSAVSAKGWFDVLNDKATIAHFTAEKFGALPIPKPAQAEQTAIARFLDHATDRIDRYIRAKEKLSALLEEQKRVIVNAAVTGRIDVRTGKPYPDYKPSGLGWLGEIPAHWQIVRNGQLFVQRNEVGFPELPILEVSLRSGVRVRDFENSSRKQVMSDRSLYKRAARGDIAYNMMRMWQGAAGVTPVDGLVSPAYVVARPREGIEPRYFDHLFHIGAYLIEVDKYSRGIVKDRNRLYWEDFKQMPAPRPPSNEQILIADAIDRKVRLAHDVMLTARQQITLANELRTRLIADAVTGKLDVREAAGALPEKPRSQCTTLNEVEGGDANQEEATKMTNWDTCPAVERKPGRVSGAWVFAGTRIPLSALYENLAGGATVDDFVEWFPGVDEQQVRTVLEHEAQTLRAELAR